ncbi:hypothetical protein FH608_044475 [Nonomuraea phyllanthi]|uniref:FAD-binding domain-containing protein n=1 Tax=Nonomuraea phyllanthi TaxID=2219224 RepID=A0A5C4VFI0_9ACTN|nr:hypothetical protein FH608_044475 [Nonomuraea phyllanthi]
MSRRDSSAEPPVWRSTSAWSHGWAVHHGRTRAPDRRTDAAGRRAVSPEGLRTITALSNYVHGFILREQRAQLSAAHGPVTRDHLADLLSDGHAALDPAGDGDAWGEQEVLERFRHLVPERTGRTDIRIKDAVWTSVFSIHRRPADTYRQGRVLLAGDAAHIHSPLGGQGVVTGMGDAENLAWKLALVIRGQATEALLDTYEAERRPLATDVPRRTTTATRLQVGDSPLMRFLRTRVLVPMANMPSVQRRAGQVASQLWVTYRRGPLATGLTSRLGRRPRPGDRVPDLACRRPDGRRTRLHAELGHRWALLAPPGSAPAHLAEARKRLGETITPLTCPADRQRDVWLIRPDAHLAWRGRATPAHLGRRLDHALRVSP